MPLICVCVSLFVDVYQKRSLLPPSSLSRCVKTSPSPSSSPLLSLLCHWPRAPRGDGALGSFDTGMLLVKKLGSMCAWHVSSRCPTDTHFMLMSSLGSAERGRKERKIGRGSMRYHSYAFSHRHRLVWFSLFS